MKEKGNRETINSNQGFESFDVPQNEYDNYFQNKYTGNFADRMLLNRDVIEKFCRLVDFGGTVNLTTSSRIRSQSYQASGDTLAIRDALNQREVINDNPFVKVRSIPQGWQIAVNDQEITRVVSEGKSKKPFEDDFIGIFNASLKQGLIEASRRELATGEKREAFKRSLAMTLYYPTVISYFFTQNIHDIPSGLFSGALIGFLTLSGWGMYTGASEINYLKTGIKQTMRDKELYLENVVDAFKALTRPPMPIDNLIASNVYLEAKGRTLVKKNNP